MAKFSRSRACGAVCGVFIFDILPGKVWRGGALLDLPSENAGRRGDALERVASGCGDALGAELGGNRGGRGCVRDLGGTGWVLSLVSEIGQKYFCPVLKTAGLGSWCGPEKLDSAWNPHRQFGEGTALAWFFVVVRIAGSSIVVPPLEESFYRSFLYRYIARPDFQSVPLGKFLWAPFLLTGLVFGFGHYEWLAGILCAFVYQGLVCWKKRLGDAMTAHAITNCLLGFWIVWKGAWHFW